MRCLACVHSGFTTQCLAQDGKGLAEMGFYCSKRHPHLGSDFTMGLLVKEGERYQLTSQRIQLG
jgi:hypothetical protein